MGGGGQGHNVRSVFGLEGELLGHFSEVKVSSTELFGMLAIKFRKAPL